MRHIDVILEQSATVDQRFCALDTIPRGLSLSFPVPVHHPRAVAFDRYEMRVCSVDRLETGPARLWVLTPTVLPVLHGLASIHRDPTLVLESIENRTKTCLFMRDVIDQHQSELRHVSEVIAVGGGLILNVAAYLAEMFELNLRLAPSTVLAMADGAGGKVRMNTIHGGRYYKHFHKSFWEPNEIVIDPVFLETLPIVQKRIGLVEIIKHGIQQSLPLLEFLERCGETLLTNNEALLKAICWAADLKRVCLEIDSEENDNGSRTILRAGHDISDRLEEELAFAIPHGYAVAIGLIEMFAIRTDDYARRRTLELFDRLGIPHSLQTWKQSLDHRGLWASHV